MSNAETIQRLKKDNEIYLSRIAEDDIIIYYFNRIAGLADIYNEHERNFSQDDCKNLLNAITTLCVNCEDELKRMGTHNTDNDHE